MKTAISHNDVNNSTHDHMNYTPMSIRSHESQTNVNITRSLSNGSMFHLKWHRQHPCTQYKKPHESVESTHSDKKRKQNSHPITHTQGFTTHLQFSI